MICTQLRARKANFVATDCSNIKAESIPCRRTCLRRGALPRAVNDQVQRWIFPIQRRPCAIVRKFGSSAVLDDEGIVCAPGKEAHRGARTAGPEDDCACIAHPCRPARRQHAGRFESAPHARINGLFSKKLNRASSALARRRRIALSVLPETLRILVWLLFPSVGSPSSTATCLPSTI